MPGQHLRFSGSAMHRTIACPGWVGAFESLTPKEQEESNRDSVASRRGTSVHAVGDMILTEYKLTDEVTEASAFLGQEVEGVLIDNDLVAIGQDYVDFCVECVEDELADDFNPEESLDLSTWKPIQAAGIDGSEVGGTMDFVALYYYKRTLRTVDLKGGAGVVVEVNNNAQLLTYTLSALNKYGFDNFDKVLITIVQPAANHPDGPIRTAEYTVEEVVQWGKEVMIPAVQEASKPGAAFRPSDKNCKFCPMDGRCSAQNAKADEDLMVDYDDVMELTDTDIIVKPKAYFPDPATLTREQRQRILANINMFTDFLAAVKKIEYAEAMQGNIAPGFKLVKSQTHRKYVSKFTDTQIHKALQRLGLSPHDYTDMPTTKSPAQIEKALKAKGIKPEDAEQFMKKYVYQPDGGYALVPYTSRGKAVTPDNPDDDYGDLYDDDLLDL